jgi:hypothetical protein
MDGRAEFYNFMDVPSSPPCDSNERSEPRDRLGTGRQEIDFLGFPGEPCERRIAVFFRRRRTCLSVIETQERNIAYSC